MSADRPSLGARLRASRGAGGNSPGTTPPDSPARDGQSDPIVRMSSLRRRPTPASRAATSAEFHADASVWVSTPVRASQRAEFADKLDYAFAYGEELAKLLRGHGFKSTVGLTLEGPEAESDFTVLLANMSHVFGPIARDEFTKLLDLDFEYDEYHLTLNELLYVVLPTILRGTALSLYDESARVHPHDGRCALQRLRYHVEGIGDPDAHRFWHRKLHPGYGDRDMVADLHTVLRSSAAGSPYVTPLYLVVIRDINDGRPFTFASLALRLGKVFRDEAPLARPTVPTPPTSGGGGRGALQI
ncbi:hypothetical protein CYMTET_56499 [Cymbomonas tetramitiformis]|uniref:Uncharacterized protein n=1 Tax=Cymbomonas tetramitiformis TaxID=36881 RepID=A0AAE0BAU3_9CHLO|nr:hypothetical protein CYMTET_56499 [Cymbomonas tetramitiformis]